MQYRNRAIGQTWEKAIADQRHFALTVPPAGRAPGKVRLPITVWLRAWIQRWHCDKVAAMTLMNRAV